MIIEPTPTNPRSPVRRAVRLAALIVPVALLAAVVAVGVLGSRPEDRTAPTPAVAGPAGTTAPSALSPSTVPASPSPAVILDGSPEPPGQLGDLSSRTVGEALAAQDEGGAAVALAVTGYLRGLGPVDGACVDEAGGSLGPWCERAATLADAPRAARDTLLGAVAPHVHLSIPIGVRLPAAVTDATRPAVDGDPRVLVIGRFGASGPRCGIGPDTCEEVLVVERFAWADGARVGLTPLIASRLDTGERRPNPFAFLDAADLPLSGVLLWPDAVAALDPAAALVAGAGSPSEPVWYVRVLDGARGPGMVRSVRWMLMAERDLRVLGAGRPVAVPAPVRR